MFDVRPCADQAEFDRAIGAIGQYFNPPPTDEIYERWARTLPRPARDIPEIGAHAERILARPAVRAALAAEGLVAPFI